MDWCAWRQEAGGGGGCLADSVGTGRKLVAMDL